MAGRIGFYGFETIGWFTDFTVVVIVIISSHWDLTPTPLWINGGCHCWRSVRAI
jgi:hypothetical protein